MKTVFLRVLDVEDKASALLNAIRALESNLRFDVDPQKFIGVPRSPFAYWVSDSLRTFFSRLSPFEHGEQCARITNQLSDNFRFVRLWFETNNTAKNRLSWVPWAKGGSFSVYYAAIHTIVAWDSERGTYWGYVGTSHRPMVKPASADFFFRPGLTWPCRTNGLSVRVMPKGCIFGQKGPAAFVGGDDEQKLLALLAVTNSRAFGFFVSLQLARTELAQSYEVGLIQQTPVPRIMDSDQSELAKHAFRAWSLKRALDKHNETSNAFTYPAFLQITKANLAIQSTSWAEHVRHMKADLAALQSVIDVRCFELYGIDEEDRRAITEGFGSVTSDAQPGDNDEPDDAADEDDANEPTADATTLAAELVSWAVGVAFGRFDVRLATGARPLPTEPEPFDPLPVCSPGMLTGEDGLPLARPPEGYPIAFPEDGVRVDDPGHAKDLTAAVRAVFDVVFGADADRWWSDVAALLDPKGRELRAWLAGSFFEEHIKRYSKSRRKAPIFWQLGTPSGRYSVWLYAHRMTRDRCFQLQSDLIAPKIAHEEQRLASLVQGAGATPTARDRKEIHAQETFLADLRAMLDEVKRVAPLWKPDLDDGVVITMAPLWRLVPQHTPWQKELKAAWDALCGESYEWAKLAMHLWPERVVPKCETDRSLAIAHGLEATFWVQDFDEKWRPRRAIEETVEYVSGHLHSPRLKQAVAEVREFWRERFVAAGRDDRQWWMELESGMHDDATIALKWWPDRVLKKALEDRALSLTHGLPWVEALPGAAKAAGKRKKTTEKRVPYLSPTELGMLAAFCVDREGYTSWEARWQAWDAGAFDESSPLALRVRTPQVIARILEKHEIARHFGIERWFWIEAEGEFRRLKEPPVESRDAIAQRASHAVKAALKSLLEAPQAGGAKKAKKGRSDA